MIKYDIKDINNIIDNMKTNNSIILDDQTQTYLINILNSIKKINKKPYNNNHNNYNNNSNNNNNNNNNNNHNNHNNNHNNNNNNNRNNYKNYNKSKFLNKDYKDYKDSKNIVSEETSYNINRIKLQNNKTDLEIHNNNIRKLLNKLSNNNFEKINNELICYYNTILTNTNIEEINVFIFNSLTLNNSIYSGLYCKLYYNLLNINEKFIDLLNNNIIVFLNIYENLQLTNENEIEVINKNNDKYICFLLFYINCFKLKLLPDDLLYTCILNIQTFLNSQLKIENNKFCCEIMTNFVFIMISNSYDLLKDEKYNEIFENIKYINSMKNGDLVGLNNKIIFKHRDIFEKYKPH